MAHDLEELKFCGMIGTVAEKEMAASITDDHDRKFRQMLYQQYIADGKPKNQKEWVRQELKKYFVFLTRPPAWIERMTIPRWPFFEGRPMVFIGQMTVPENGVSKAVVAPSAALYVFGSKKSVDGVPGGWEMVYRVIEQVQDL